MRLLTEEEWDAEFTTTSENLLQFDEIPEGTKAKYVWTEVEGDDDDVICISAGFHIVNNLGYWVTHQPHDFEMVVEIEIERGD